MTMAAKKKDDGTVHISLIGNSVGAKHGDEREVDEATAAKLVRLNHAQYVSEPPATEGE
jgi:hypothetical protein